MYNYYNISVKPKLLFDFSKEKDELLKETKGVSFEDIIQAIKLGHLIDNKTHPNQKKYPGQKLFVVKIGSYIYVAPYVIDHKRRVFFLKTVYPSRKLTKQYIRNESYEKK